MTCWLEGLWPLQGHVECMASLLEISLVVILERYLGAIWSPFPEPQLPCLQNGHNFISHWDCDVGWT